MRGSRRTGLSRSRSLEPGGASTGPRTPQALKAEAARINAAIIIVGRKAQPHSALQGTHSPALSFYSIGQRNAKRRFSNSTIGSGRPEHVTFSLRIHPAAGDEEEIDLADKAKNKWGFFGKIKKFFFQDKAGKEG